MTNLLGSIAVAKQGLAVLKMLFGKVKVQFKKTKTKNNCLFKKQLWDNHDLDE